jgi:aminoglycoside/choline kinase family phosphotransferase
MPDLADADFLVATGWAEATAAPLAGDASARSYQRLTRADGATAVLMRSGADDSTPRFLTIAHHLTTLGFSAPEVLAGDPQEGRLLLEDLGDSVFARLIEADPAAEPTLYRAAAGFLADLHRHPAPADLAVQTPAMLAAAVAPAADWYLGRGTAQPAAAAALAWALEPALATILPAPQPVLVHRDFHAENLIWLPGRAGAAQVGLLDFQDALIGHPAYDLVSLVEDARRDLSPGIRAAAVEEYARLTGSDPAALDAAMAILGAQRNLRILGIFARLTLAAAKPRYVPLIPRVWGHLQRDLAHPALAPLAETVARLLPAPGPDLLADLTDRCGTIPAQ